MSRSIEFYGETFDLVEQVSEFAILELAEATSDGSGAEPMEQGAALLRLVKECVAPAQANRFLVVARKNRARTEDLMEVVLATVGTVAERPTSRPSDSSDGPVRIGRKSGASSDEKDSEPFSGRPDLMLAVQRQQTA